MIEVSREYVQLLGWVNVVLLALVLLLFVIRRSVKIFHWRFRWLPTVMKGLAIVHPFLGGLLVLLGALHGYLALHGHIILRDNGRIFLHTGQILWLTIVLMGCLFVSGKFFNLPNWLKWHRAGAVLVILSLILHLYFRRFHFFI